uniref:Uncharacterized protein n=1 Tax=Brassica oleracea TaxID=3712 RepID=A0A3P6C187_BRAOL|nr:unnamed protein product [Brassica oleracea]
MDKPPSHPPTRTNSFPIQCGTFSCGCIRCSEQPKPRCCHYCQLCVWV